MQSTDANSCGPERDLLCGGPARVFFGVYLVLPSRSAFGPPPALKTVLWATSLAFMGVTCLANAAAAVALTASSRGRFSPLELSPRSDTVLAFCHLDYLGGIGMSTRAISKSFEFLRANLLYRFFFQRFVGAFFSSAVCR